MSKTLKYVLVSILLLVTASIIVAVSLNSKTGVADYGALCENSPDKINCITSESLQQAANIGPVEALNNLEQYAKNTKLGTVECHLIYHSIGSSYYKKFGEKSYIPGISGCSGAYYHGIVLESSASYKGDPELFSEKILGFCNNFTETDFIYCVHGIGHGAYYVANKNLEKATEICLQIRWSSNCSGGLWMELIEDETNAAQFNLTSFVNMKVQECNNVTNKLLNSACIMHLHLENIINDKNVEEVCSYGTTKDSSKCKLYYGIILGLKMMSSYINSASENELVPNKELISPCLADETCLNGFIVPLGEFVEKEEALQACEFYLKNYGDIKQVDKCLNTNLLWKVA